MLNRVMIAGNVGRDPDTKHTSSGMVVTNLSIATDEYSKDGGEKVEWHRVVLFGKQAEVAEKYLKKGSKVFIEGRLKTDSWEKDGVKHFRTNIIGDRMKFLGAKPANGAAPSQTEEAAPSKQAEFEDDIPF